MSCLFRSLGSYEGSEPAEMRRRICDHLQGDPVLAGKRASEWVRALDEADDLGRYVARMRRSRTWGGALEIRAYCDLHGTSVEVQHDSGGKPIEFLASGSLETAVVHWNGGHYTPVHASKVCRIGMRLRSSGS